MICIGARKEERRKEKGGRGKEKEPEQGGAEKIGRERREERGEEEIEKKICKDPIKNIAV